MNRTVSRRIERLEESAGAARKAYSFSARMILVDPEKGATGVVVLESGKPNRHEPATPEEVEEVRADLERRRAGRERPLSAGHQH